MGDFWNKRVDDFYNGLLNTVWYMVLTSLSLGGMAAFVTLVVRTVSAHPFEWKLILAVFAVSSLGLMVVILLAARHRTPHQQQSNQALAPPVTASLAGGTTQIMIDEMYFGFEASHRKSIEEPLRAEISTIPVDGGNRENYLIRSLMVSVIAIEYLQIWIYVYGSQIQALEALNKGSLSREQIAIHYTFAAAVYPLNYASYTFDNWLAYMRDRALLTESGTMIVILPKGRDFLKWLINTGRSSTDRLY